MKEQLKDYSTVVEIPVAWGEMDAALHVSNLIYLRYSETARIVFFEKAGISTNFAGDEAGVILGWQDCKYIFPMTYPDTAVVGMKVHEVKSDRLVMECAIFSKKHQRIAAISKQEIIPYNYSTLKKVPMPEKWLALK